MKNNRKDSQYYGYDKVKVALPKAVIALVMAVASVAGLSACTSPSLWFKSDDQKIETILNSKSVKDKLASTNKRFQNRISVSLSHEGKTIIYTLKLKNQGATDEQIKEALEPQLSTLWDSMQSSATEVIDECRKTAGVNGVKVRIDLFAEHGLKIGSKTYDR